MLSLATDRLTLRDFQVGDWESVNAILSDREAMKFMHFASWGDTERREWFAWCISNVGSANTESLNWAITGKNSGEFVGWLGIGDADQPTMEGERVFGNFLRRQDWGSGLMTEALVAVLGYEFDVLRMQRVFAYCDMENTGSRRVMEKAGMKQEGVFDGPDFMGNWSRRYRYGISALEWQRLRNK